MVSFSVLVVALIAFSQGLVNSSQNASSQRKRDLGIEGARRVLERIQSEDIAQVFALYNSDGADDPGGAGTAPGPNFAVDGLNELASDADGFVGQVLFPVAAQGGLEQLREDLPNPSFGTPKDLNGDGLIDAADHSADYQVLPVRVRVTWISDSGPASVELKTILKGL